MENLKSMLRAKTEPELRALCAEKSKTLYIRHYYRRDPYTGERYEDTDGTSEDVKRDATPEESAILENLMYSVLLGLRWREASDLQTALDVVEFAADQMIPRLNGYLSIYSPLNDILRELKENFKEGK